MTVKCKCLLRDLIWKNTIILLYSILQVAVNIRLYEYWYEQVKIRKQRWNDKEIIIHVWIMSLYVMYYFTFDWPTQKRLHIIGQIIYYVTDLKNVPLLDYGGV
jgi:hypothetical protein